MKEESPMSDSQKAWSDRCDNLVKQNLALRAELEAIQKQEPVAWRYQDARGHYRYRSYVANFDTDYKLLKPVALYAHPKQDHTALLKMALEALEKAADTTYSDTCLAQFNAAIAAIKEELK